jgi:hypothetical protein
MLWYLAHLLCLYWYNACYVDIDATLFFSEGTYQIAAIVEGSLYICADGSYFKAPQQGSHAWVFTTQQHKIHWKG